MDVSLAFFYALHYKFARSGNTSLHVYIMCVLFNYLCMYVCVFYSIITLEVKNHIYLCILFPSQGAYFLSVFGYVLAFSAVLAKMWRVFYIFHNPTTKKRSLKDWHLLLVVAILTGIVLLLLIIGTAVPDLRQTAMLVDDKEHSDSENVNH